jgi:PHP family Zn ribbon phosphoesterase
MERIKSMALLVSVAGIALLLGGCGGSYQARSMDLKQALLVNPNMLTEGTGDQALYRYENPKANFKQYTKIMIDPVLVSKSAELDADDMENYQKLANNAYVYLTQELQKDYQVVSAPEPNTLRVQMAIVDADTSKPVRNLLSSISPVGIVISLGKYSVTGKQTGVGEISAEFKIADASTGELLGAAVDRRVGGKAAQGIWDTWYNADQALQYWAKKARFVLCERRSGTNCEKP